MCLVTSNHNSFGWLPTYVASEFLGDADRWTESEEHKTILNVRLTGQNIRNIYIGHGGICYLYTEACCGVHTMHIPAPMKKDMCLCNSAYSIVYASQTDNASSRLFAMPSLWTVTHQLNLSPLPFPCTPSHLPSSSLPNKGVTKMTKDSPHNEMQLQAEKSTRIQFHPKTNILRSIALHRFYLLVFHQFGRLKASADENYKI